MNESARTNDSSPPAPDYVRLTRENEDVVLAAEAAGSAVVPAPPMKFTFEFTGDCNIHCFFCDCEFNRNEFRKKGFTKFSMDEATFRALAENAFPRATVVNPTVIGEPFSFPFFDLLLDYAERFSVKLELVTNGMLLKGPRVARLLPLLDRLSISFDGGTKETFDKCRTGADFDVVMQNLSRFAALRRDMGLERQVKFTFAVTLMADNIAEFPRIVEIAHELGASDVNAAHLLVFTEEMKSHSLFEKKAEANHWLSRAKETATRLGMNLTAPAPFPDASADDSHASATSVALPPKCDHLRHELPAPEWAENGLWCKFAWREAFVNIAGEVAPCCHQGRPVVGNVFQEKWEDIWNGPQYQAIRKGLRDGKPTAFCATCPLLAERGFVPYDRNSHMYADRYPDQTRADIRPERKKR